MGRIRRATVAVALAVGTTACGDSTVLTGPDAEAAFAEARATEGRPLMADARNVDDQPAPAIFVDGVRVTGDPRSVLRQIRPEDIERLEVHMGCRSYGYLGEDGHHGLIDIYTRAHDGETTGLIYDETRGERCLEELRQSGRVPWKNR